MAPRHALAVSLLFISMLVAGPLLAATYAQRLTPPDPDEFEVALPEGKQLTGEQIYRRFLERRLRSAVQHQVTVSEDPGGNRQESRLWVGWRDYRDKRGRPDADGVRSKTVVRFTEPTDLRGTAYLIIDRGNAGTEQFVYQRSARRSRRVALEGVTLAGTDLTFGDFAVQELDDATYERLADAVVEGEPVYVVQATLKPEADAHYQKTVSYLTRDHFVPLRVRFWDQAGVEIRELTASPETVQEFEGFWVATEQRMTNLLQRTSTALHIERLQPNRRLPAHVFTREGLERLRDY